ncbi:hypothetical protein GE107_15910 [Cohnella sp. CFH 77786]|uniref:hypothetical protein n=1 Tax=Cohnella sp. CFH 77786 TaxID=2662265 RepID=UPI001C60B6AA|nr:hypothetical protein [Cohnella sp. CFH 77786]MBW5447544.1 hypothetical protein [Cohnella sp. CFH 77786]
MQQMQPPMQQNAAVMPKPPQVITTKDSQYLKDMLSWELLAMKKCSHFAKECQDQEIRTALDKAGQMHQHHYTVLLKHLQNNNTQAMQSVPQLQQ